MSSAFTSKQKLLWANIFLSFILAISFVLVWLNPANSQQIPPCSKPIECFTLGQQKLQQAQTEIRQQNLKLQSGFKELDKIKSQITELQNQLTSVNSTVSTVSNTANQAQNTANQSVGLANQAQSTANQSVGLANQAQSTANQSSGLSRQGDMYVLQTAANNVIHIGPGGICYYESGNRRWCLRT
jgi:septal ring factor EnvC (AmiA/AmiB activator)